jgi:hypothetical protein
MKKAPPFWAALLLNYLESLFGFFFGVKLLFEAGAFARPVAQIEHARAADFIMAFHHYLVNAGGA